jgi:hypothetical protein
MDPLNGPARDDTPPAATPSVASTLGPPPAVLSGHPSGPNAATLPPDAPIFADPAPLPELPALSALPALDDDPAAFADSAHRAPSQPLRPTSTPLALIDIVDRDGQVRQSVPVHAWPVRIGRALDNDLVLSDPHVAPAHLVIGRDAGGLQVQVGDTRNGVLFGRRRWRADEQATVSALEQPVELGIGRTRLRVRLPEQALPAEVALASATPLLRRMRPILIASVVLLAALVFNTYLETDPQGMGRAIGSTLITAIGGAAIWCSAWALLSKTFTRQSHFGWHLRVFLYSSIALLALGALAPVLGFALSWSWPTDFAFVASFIVGAAALYYHLLAVEPARHRVLRWVVGAGAVAGIAVTLWNNQRSDQWGDELYMNHLLPPAMRLARPVPATEFVDDLSRLKATLDKKAREPSGPDDGAPRSDEE